MIRIAAVDDEPHVLERFERMVTPFQEVKLCGLFETGEQLMAYLKEQPIDAVFLDIEMPGVNGLELSAQILDRYEEVHIIFVTAYNQYAIEAFEVQAMDYILKPLTLERLNKTLQRLLKKQRPIKCQEKPRIQCFGDFEVFIGQEALSWKNSKAKEILAFLVQKKGVPVNWEKIANAVWPEYNTEKAQTNFHATTYLLRKRLSEAGISQILESGRGNYRIIPDLIECDLYRLEELLLMHQLNRKEDIGLLEALKQKGYLEASGYGWALPKAAELEKAVIWGQAIHE